MLVLRKDLQERVRSQIRADLRERNARPGLALDPEPNGWDIVTARDNEIGEVTLRLPAHFRQYQAELLEDLYDEFFAAPAGDRKVQDEMNLYVAEWLKKKEGGEAQSL